MLASCESLLLSYLVLETSFYTKKQFKAFKSLQAFNQMVSGFVTLVVGKLIADKYVVRASVRHSQLMNDDPSVNTDLRAISKNDGTILSAHCLGCKAGLAGLHIVSVLFYLEATTRIHEKLAMLMDFCRYISVKCRMRGLRTSIFHRLASSGQRKARPENQGLKIYNSRKPRTF